MLTKINNVHIQISKHKKYYIQPTNIYISDYTSRWEYSLPCSYRSFMFVSFRDTRQFKMPMICFTALLTGLDLWSCNNFNFIYNTIIMVLSTFVYTVYIDTLWKANLIATTFSSSISSLLFHSYLRLGEISQNRKYGITGAGFYRSKAVYVSTPKHWRDWWQLVRIDHWLTLSWSTKWL